MDIDLARASREELLAVIAAQAEELATLRTRIAELEAALGRAEGKARQPQVKPSVPAPAVPKPKRRPRAHGYGRPRSAEVTQRVQHVLATCPECGELLTGGWVHR